MFDNGVKRALDGSIDYELRRGSFEYGILFEQFIIIEILRQIAYRERSVSSSFLATEGGLEIDLVLEKAGRVVALIEIKSSSKIDSEDLRHLKAISSDFQGAHCFCLYDGETAYREDSIRVLPWQQGVEEVVNLV